MPFTIPFSYPVPLAYSGPPDVIRGTTLTTLLERDRFVFAKNRRMLASFSRFLTTNTATYDTAARMWVHNSLLTEGTVSAACFGQRASVKITINGVTVTSALVGTNAFFFASITPAWTDNTWVEVKVEVKSTSGTGGFFGLYLLEDALTEPNLP